MLAPVKKFLPTLNCRFLCLIPFYSIFTQFLTSKRATIPDGNPRQTAKKRRKRHPKNRESKAEKQQMVEVVAILESGRQSNRKRWR